MTLIRLTGFASALAIHGLLLAAVPQQDILELNSSVFNLNTISLSVNFQASSKTPTRPETRVADISTDSHKKFLKQPEKVIPIAKAPPPPFPKLNNIKHKLSKTNKHTTKNSETNFEAAKEASQAQKTQTINQPSTTTQKLSSSMTSAMQGIHQDIVTEPLFSRPPIPPIYPRIARKRGQQGIVWVDISLNRKGQQTVTEIFKSSGVSPLDQAALEAVRQWQFVAHRINNIAVASHIRIPVEFSLE